MTPNQCRQARQLLNMKHVELATLTGISTPTLRWYESSGRLDQPRIDRIRAVFESAGVRFGEAIVNGPSRQSVPILTGSICQKARRFLSWTQQDLADTSGLSAPQISSFERREEKTSVRDRIYSGQIRAALEQAGIEFVDDEGARLRLRRSRS